MPNYPALLAEISLPAYSGMTDAQIIAAVNAKTVAAPKPAVLSPNNIMNAITTADLSALVSAGVTGTNKLLIMLSALAGSSVDASPGTTTRAIFVALFPSGQSATNLAALVAPYDNATASWSAATIGIHPITQPDLDKARS
jgi:hypothetical protein